MGNIKKQSLSQNFIHSVVELCAGFMPSSNIDRLFDLIESELSKTYFTSSSEANLLRIILGMYNKRTFLEESLKYPHYIEILVVISANSNYLTDILVRDPEYFYLIINPSNLNTCYNENEFRTNILNILHSFNSLVAKSNALKAIKRKEILRIGLNDLLGYKTLEETTNDLSILARSIASVLFQTCYQEVLVKYGIKKLTRKYTLVALGKLGGSELNYSSDIDLVIFYDKNTQVTQKKDYQEILTEAILLFIENATSITETGFLYRVDFRLRPDGKNSPLCNTLSSYCNYYETRGEDWERQMLIKADYIAGNKDLYNKFMMFISPFIYPVNFDSSPLLQVRKLKNEIEKNLSNEENIKLNPGGIRNIEFSIQALQLINGGKIPDVKSPNTLIAIKKLTTNNFLTQSEFQVFTEAYIFYRRIEHFLQLMNDTQTHTIPSDGELLEKLSRFLNFENTVKFLLKVNEYKSRVLQIYSSITGENSTNDNKSIPLKVEFKNPEKAAKDYNYLKYGKGLLGQKQFDKQSIIEFQKIEPELINYLSVCDDPDLVIQNFARVIRNAKFPSIWYKEFSDNIFFNNFLAICRYSQRSIDLFSEDKDLRDYFLSRKFKEKLTTASIEKISLKELVFHSATQLALNNTNPIIVSRNLTNFFTFSINKIVMETAGLKNDNNFIIAALGSFGTCEMSFGSDIDLIFVSNETRIINTKEKLFQSLLLKLKKEFSPFQVDCRLRPEGKSSQLCWDLSAYQNYLRSRARTWELQAFCKLTFISGNTVLFRKLTNSIKKRIDAEKEVSLKNDILEMRKKLYPGELSRIANAFNIKKDRGGISDIEFACQYLILSEPRVYSKLRGKPMKQLLMWLADNGIIDNSEELIEGYVFLKTLLFAHQVIYNSSSSTIRLEDEKLNTIVKFLYYNDNELFKKKLHNIILTNIHFFEKIINT